MLILSTLPIRLLLRISLLAAACRSRSLSLCHAMLCYLPRLPAECTARYHYDTVATARAVAAVPRNVNSVNANTHRVERSID